jgi:alpha,alpha-trehalose-phosphate synthase [UDP-forming]
MESETRESGARLLVVSHRGPVTLETRRGETRYRLGTGGLVAALDPILKSEGGLWIASGDNPPGHEAGVPFAIPGRPGMEVVHLEIPVRLHERHYLGFSNRVLWPLAHGFPNMVHFQRRDLVGYLEVNEIFADAVLQHARPRDVVWVHDYQLAAVPALVRAKRPDARISFFWHIPFPGYEVFRALPYHEDLIAGLLGADHVNFHLESYAAAFRGAVQTLLGATMAGNRAVTWNGREVEIGAVPIGIDAGSWESTGAQPRVQREARSIRELCGTEHIILGVDRLDYTKGILERIRAVERLLDTQADLRGEFCLVQIAVPSRTRVPEYREMRREIDETVGRVNARFARGSYVPVRYYYRGFSPRSLATYYRAADVGLVTPLRDGMNLVAMEFVMANADRPVVLILSELAGASEVLDGALLVNPYDLDGVAEGIRSALEMNPNERRRRTQALVEQVRGHDVHAWARTNLEQLRGGVPASFGDEAALSRAEAGPVNAGS